MRYLFVLFAIIFNICRSDYSVPPVKVEVLSPKGFKLSLPDEKDIKLVAFHISIGKALEGFEEGDISVEVTQPTDGFFEYKNDEEALEPGDVIYYWLHIQKGNLAYKKLGQSHTVTKNDGSPATPAPPVIATTATPAPTNDYIPVVFPSDSKELGLDDIFCPGGTSQTTYNRNTIPCKGQLIFEENFNTLNTSIWQKVVQIAPDTYDADFVAFTDKVENVYISNSQLHIVPTPNQKTKGHLQLFPKCTATDLKYCSRRSQGFYILPSIHSAKVDTKHSFSFRYGRVIVRAKLPKGDWMFPLLTLDPLNYNYGTKAYQSGQLRIAFSRGNDILKTDGSQDIGGSLLYGGPILGVGEENRQTYASLKDDKLWSSDFHEYGLEWSPSEIKLFVDGRFYGTIQADKWRSSQTTTNHLWERGNRMAPFDQEFQISLGMSVGGISDFPEHCKSGLQQIPKPYVNGDPKAEYNFWRSTNSWITTWDQSSKLVVDYVKVYAL